MNDESPMTNDQGPRTKDPEVQSDDQHHTPIIPHHSSFVIRHSSFVIPSSVVTSFACHSSLITFHSFSSVAAQRLETRVDPAPGRIANGGFGTWWNRHPDGSAACTFESAFLHPVDSDWPRFSWSRIPTDPLVRPKTQSYVARGIW